MTNKPLRDALEREHREIDKGVEIYLASFSEPSPEPLQQAIAALRRHIYLEEALLFPPLRGGELTAAIFVMLREHGEIWNAMATISTALETDPFRAGEAAKALLTILAKHNEKEEPIFYAQMDEILPEEARSKLLDAILNSALPEGWTCARAARQ